MKPKITFFIIYSLIYISHALPENKENWDGDFYEKHSSMQQESANELLDSIHFKETDSVLDVGCGDGKITASIAQQVPGGKVVGLDISQNMILTAQEKHAHITNISFAVANAAKFTLTQEFDYAVSFYALHWVQDMLSTLKNIKNVLKPGGKLFVKIATKLDICPIQGFFNRLDPNGKWAAAKQGRETNFFNKNVEEFETLLDQAGFKNHNVRVVWESFDFENFDKLVLWFMGWIPHCIKLSDEKNLEFCKELVQYLYDKKMEDDIKEYEKIVSDPLWNGTIDDPWEDVGPGIDIPDDIEFEFEDLEFEIPSHYDRPIVLSFPILYVEAQA